MSEDGRPVALNVLVPSDTVANLGQHRPEGGFADIEWITSEVVAVQFDEVERIEEYVAIIAPIANVVEGCDTIVVADDCLAVDDARPAAWCVSARAIGGKRRVKSLPGRL